MKFENVFAFGILLSIAGNNVYGKEDESGDKVQISKRWLDNILNFWKFETMVRPKRCIR